MAVLRNPNPGGPEVRAAMEEFLSFCITAYYGRPGYGADYDPAGWRRQLRLLEAGEPVTTKVWQLPPNAPYPAHLKSGDYVTVSSDGTVSEA